MVIYEYKEKAMSKVNFYEKVYAVVSQIPIGKVATYGQVAMLCGSPRAARAVGFALHANPQPGIIPCHRIVNREGRLAKSFAFGGIDRQKELLEKEGVTVNVDTVDLKVYLWDSSNFILE